jgi:phosphoglycerate dehydrogenase-like enzyme
MIDTAALAKFKPGAYLINAARGPVVEARALADALMEGRLAGAAVDVYDPEPPPPDHPLMAAPTHPTRISAQDAREYCRHDDVVDDVVIRVLAGEVAAVPGNRRKRRAP